MATSQIFRSSSDPAARADGKTGMNIDPGPYEAEVISHVVNTRMGQLMVYIPDFGGVKTDPNAQIKVNYCSPFYGKTYGTDDQISNSTAPEAQWTTGQSYGMWMIPPDVGNKVLVIFAAGDRNRGYWIGCIYDSMSHHMVPGIARNIGGGVDTGLTVKPLPSSDPLNNSLSDSSNVPVVEAYSGDKTAFTKDGINSTPRYAHEYQTNILVSQGLDQDYTRGAISSSSLRESPSNVYGISTPGRSVTGTQQVKSSLGENATQAVVARQGGHQLVMDDGDIGGNDQLIRLRTSGGHQILMNDVADSTPDGQGIIYIASASGNQWIEFSSDGSINIFNTSGLNIRSQSDINIHSDTNININASGEVNINGDDGVNITSPVNVDITALDSSSIKTTSLYLLGKGGVHLISGGAMAVSSTGASNIMGSTVDINTSSPITPPKLPDITTNSLPDVSWNGTNWTFNTGVFNSICTIAPAHEPWIDVNTGIRPQSSN